MAELFTFEVMVIFLFLRTHGRTDGRTDACTDLTIIMTKDFQSTWFKKIKLLNFGANSEFVQMGEHPDILN